MRKKACKTDLIYSQHSIRSPRRTSLRSSQLVLLLTAMYSVRAVINLEAAGTTGRELLFQASSEQMIQAYSHVPRPFGTILANDIFSSGFILSEYVHLHSTNGHVRCARPSNAHRV